MSTRCQIGVYSNETDAVKDGHVFIYRHSDGYPDSEHGVVAQLLPFLNEFHKMRGIEDDSYCIARIIQHLTNLTDSPSYPISKYTGYGVDTSLHGDIEYFYHVSPTALLVFSTGYDAPPKCWKLIERHPVDKRIPDR